MNKRIIGVITAVVAVVGLAACEESSDENRQEQNVREETQAVNQGLERMLDSQPIPRYDWSQERATLIDTETIRSQGTASTTLFYLEGVGLVFWCPSIGTPVPSTYQLTASQQYVDLPGDQTPGKFPVDQMEPTGAYVGESAATWSVCLDDAGKKFGMYWEAPVASVIGTLSGLPRDQRLEPSDLTFEFTTEESSTE